MIVTLQLCPPDFVGMGIRLSVYLLECRVVDLVTAFVCLCAA